MSSIFLSLEGAAGIRTIGAPWDSAPGEARGPDQDKGGGWDLEALEGWISGGGEIFGGRTSTGQTTGTGALYRGLGQSPWMERCLGPRLVAAREAEALGLVAGGGGTGLLGKKALRWARRGSTGPHHSLQWPASASPCRSPKPATASLWLVQLEGTPHVGWCGSVASARLPRVLMSFHCRRHLPGGSAWCLTPSPGDPMVTPIPYPAARLAPWTGSQTNRACSRSCSFSKTHSRLTQPRNASCRMYPSFLLGLGEAGRHL